MFVPFRVHEHRNRIDFDVKINGEASSKDFVWHVYAHLMCGLAGCNWEMGIFVSRLYYDAICSMLMDVSKVILMVAKEELVSD